MATATAPPEYLLGDAADERTRLMAQAALLEDEARALLDRVDIPLGADVIDIGCGPIGVLPLLSDRVGQHGQVTGFDRHGDRLDHAARTCAGLGNDRFALGDATDTGFTPGTFDLAHIRLLLVNVPDPIAVLREAARIVRPGGAVVVQEVDWLTWQCEPGLPAWAELREVLLEVWHSRGLDPEIGRRLPMLLRMAGLCEVEATARGGHRWRRASVPPLDPHVRRPLPRPHPHRRPRHRRRARRARRGGRSPRGRSGHRGGAGDDRAGVGPGRAAGVSSLVDDRSAAAGDQFGALSATFDGWTRAHLDACGLGPGWACSKVGPGGPAVPAWLAERVGRPGGSWRPTSTRPGGRPTPCSASSAATWPPICHPTACST